jgi:hypothetical protein
VTTTATPVRARPAAVVVAGAVLVAVVVNLAIYGIGRAVGADFAFTAAGGSPTTVDAVTVAGFTAVPLLVGLTAAALLRRWSWVIPTALVVAPLLAVATIFLMTIPADLDTRSTVALACCHLALVPISVLALRALRD